MDRLSAGLAGVFASNPDESDLDLFLDSVLSVMKDKKPLFARTGTLIFAIVAAAIVLLLLLYLKLA
ncbi:hypothetical protein CRV066 [Nile crocodilepox virus]|uniref:IMV membrane protein n=1 Tax=Nile crocodilepox virus (isolate Crocodylus niloticus/Zimbabwe/Ume/2001) TaxID=1289473 RepID=Q070I5_CPRVZ|nr:hypothetical protein CRV066 [Nile crocodilepox virus]ABJ08957.1 hypothetical protein CRV066 [Nile crocodilepox virus]